MTSGKTSLPIQLTEYYVLTEEENEKWRQDNRKLFCIFSLIMLSVGSLLLYLQYTKTNTHN